MSSYMVSILVAFTSSGLIPHYVPMLPLILFSGIHQSRLNKYVEKEDPFH